MESSGGKSISASVGAFQATPAVGSTAPLTICMHVFQSYFHKNMAKYLNDTRIKSSFPFLIYVCVCVCVRGNQRLYQKNLKLSAADMYRWKLSSQEPCSMTCSIGTCKHTRTLEIHGQLDFEAPVTRHRPLQIRWENLQHLIRPQTRRTAGPGCCNT